MRYLDLSRNGELKELPNSICSLLQLQTLDIQFCWNLSRGLEGIYGLDSLQHLLLWDTPLSRCFHEELGELTGLRTLDQFHGGNGRSKLGLLNKLNSLTGFLALNIKVSGSCDLEELVGDVVEIDLKNKIHLRDIRIHFEYESTGEEGLSSSSSSLWVDIIEVLEPYHKLQKIALWNYKEYRLPHWISSPLNYVRDIDLKNYSWVSSLSSLGKLPFLETLFMNGLQGVKVVGAECSTQQYISSSSSSTNTNSPLVAFPKLTHLEFRGLTSWEEWEDITVEEEESEAIQIMPSLVTLEITFCSKLKKLPHRFLRKAQSLKHLGIKRSEELKKFYKDEDGNSTLRSISLNNIQLSILII